jgi:hypothetical protein
MSYSKRHTENMKDPSRIRQEIRKLQKERYRIEMSLFRPYPMVPYALIESWGECGKKGCRCHRGKLHGPYWYLSQHWGGKTRNLYVPREKVERIKVLADRYKAYEGSLTRIRRLHQAIMGLLKEIERRAFVPPSRLYLKPGARSKR